MLKTDLNSDCVTYRNLVGMAPNGERGHLMSFHGWDGRGQPCRVANRQRA